MINRKAQPRIQGIKELAVTPPDLIIFPNGVRAYVISSGQEDLIKLEVIYKAGSYFQEIPLQSYAVSQLIKEGTKNYTSLDISGIMDYHGAYLEQSSGKDVTESALFCLGKSFGSLLPVFEDIVKWPVFPQHEIDIFLQNEKQEFLVSNEKVRFLATRKFNELLFGAEHPYGKMVNIIDFDKVRRDYLCTFHNRFFGSDNCYIILSGKITDQILRLTGDIFGSTPWGSVNPTDGYHKNFTPAEPGSYRISKNGAIQHAVRIGKPMFNKKHPAYFDVLILSTALGGYFGSRLMTNLREDKGYTYGIRSNLVSYQKNGYFSIHSEVGSEYVDDAIREIEKEIYRLCAEPIQAKELELVKNYLNGVLLRQLDGPFALSEAVKGVIEYGLTTEYFMEFIDRINTVSAGDLMDAAQKYLDPASMISLVAGNYNSP